MRDQWISIRQAAVLSGYTPYHLRRLMRTKVVQGRKVITVWTVSKASLQKYLRMQSRKQKRGPKAKMK